MISNRNDITVSDYEDSLVQRAIKGDPQAFEQLLIAMHPRLLAEVRRALPTCLRAFIEPSDVLQDTYYDAYNHFKSFTPEGDDATYRWLRQIARNRMLELLRRHRAMKRGGGHRTLDAAALAATSDSVEWALEQVVIYQRTPSASAMAHEAIAAVEAAVDRLPADYREVINLRYIATLPVRTVAIRLRTTEAAVKMTCVRALERLRTELRVEFQQKLT